VDGPQRPGHPSDHEREACDYRCRGEACKHHHNALVEQFDTVHFLLGTFDMALIRLAERDKLVVEGGAHLAAGVIVAEHTCRGRALGLRKPHQFLADVDELGDPARQFLDLAALGFDRALLPELRGRLDLDQALQQELAERLRRLPVGRHVDAARIRHYGVDLAVDALEIE
jgi:hypothetical protein